MKNFKSEEPLEGRDLGVIVGVGENKVMDLKSGEFELWPYRRFVESKSMDEAFNRLTGAGQGTARILSRNELYSIRRKRERKRMYELVYKYNYIKKLILILIEMPCLSNYKIVVSNNIKSVMLWDDVIFITPLESRAMKDWIKVLNCKSPIDGIYDLD